MDSFFPGVASDGPCASEAGDVSTEAEVRRSRRQRRAVITRRLVPLSGEEPGPIDFGSCERSRVLLEQAFDDGMAWFQMRILPVLFLVGSSFVDLFRPFCC